MRVGSLAVVGAVVLLFGLACGGGSGDGGASGALFGPAVGPYATTYAEHMAKTNGVPCPTYSVGDEVSIGNGTFVLTEAKLIEPVRTSPNGGERRLLGDTDVKGLVTTFRLRNDSPLKVETLPVMYLVTTSEGETAMYLGEATDQYRTPLGLEMPRDMAPGKWVDTAYVYGSTVGAAQGAVMFLSVQVDRKDARGNWYVEVTEQAVIDLGAPTGP